jgi:hypothetical protein
MGKLSLALGLGVGYVLGAQAGRARFEQIKQAASGLMQRPEVKQALDKAQTAAPAPLRSGIEKLTGAASGGQASDEGTPSPAPDSAGGPAREAPLADPLVPPARSSDSPQG